jgi:hypothetical protein
MKAKPEECQIIVSLDLGSQILSDLFSLVQILGINPLLAFV